MFYVIYFLPTMSHNLSGYTYMECKSSHSNRDDTKIWLQLHFVTIVFNWQERYAFSLWLRPKKTWNFQTDFLTTYATRKKKRL